MIAVPTIDERLALARRHVEAGRLTIVYQRQMVERLKAVGRDTKAAEELLAVLEQTLDSGSESFLCFTRRCDRKSDMFLWDSHGTQHRTPLHRCGRPQSAFGVIRPPAVHCAGRALGIDAWDAKAHNHGKA
jgi:hypothetical protein